MAAHVYWRLNIGVLNGGSTPRITEIELRTSVGGANVATGGTASGYGGTAGDAFDASTATQWIATSSANAGWSDAWIAYQFGTAQDIVEHAITGPINLAQNAPKNWSIQYSDDGLSWTSAAIVTNQTGWTLLEQRVFTHASYPVAIGVGTLLATYLPAVSVTQPAASVRATLRNDAGLQTSAMISGIVKQSSVAVARTVRAYCRLTGEILGETTSNASTGAFSLNARGKTDQCYVVVLDDLTVGVDYNAQIFDLVIPV